MEECAQKVRSQLILTDQYGIDTALWKYNTISLVTACSVFSPKEFGLIPDHLSHSQSKSLVGVFPGLE